MDPSMFYGQMPGGPPGGQGGYPGPMGMGGGYGGMDPSMAAIGEQFGGMGVDDGRGARGGRGGGRGGGGRGGYGLAYGMDPRMMGGKGAPYPYGGRGAMGHPGYMGGPVSGQAGYDDPRKRDDERDRERARSGVRGLRTGFVATPSGAIGAGTSAMSSEVARIKESVNSTTLECSPKNARFFVIKSYSEDDVHKSIKYEARIVVLDVTHTEPVESRIRPNGGFGEIPGKLLTLK